MGSGGQSNRSSGFGSRRGGGEGSNEMDWRTVAVEEEMLLWEKVATSEWDPGPTVEWEISAE